MIEKSIILTSTRGHLIQLVKDLSAAQLNQVPTGFNNNISWNMAHLIATFERIVYLRTGVQGSVEVGFSDRFKNGTKPEGPASDQEISFIKETLLSQMVQFDLNYDRLKEAPYESWSTSAGVLVTSLDSAIDFLAFHEGVHMGAVLALRHLI